MKLHGLPHKHIRCIALSVSSNGSTWVKLVEPLRCENLALPFSILERIDVGETNPHPSDPWSAEVLSVSSNGSTWVKLETTGGRERRVSDFQYPRTDRRG